MIELTSNHSKKIGKSQIDVSVPVFRMKDVR